MLMQTIQKLLTWSDSDFSDGMPPVRFREVGLKN